MNKIQKHVVMRNKAFHLLFSFFMNKVSEYDTKQLLQELSLGRLNYKEILIREIQKDVRSINEPTAKVYNRRNNIFTKRRKTRSEELRNIDLIAYIFSNIKGLLEYQYIRRLTHDDIKNMARFIRYEFYPKDSYIFRQGDKSNKFYGIIDGEIQIVEARFTDRLKALKELIIKLDEREKISEEDKIFFLSGNNYKENYNDNENDINLHNFKKKKNENNNNLEDDISIKTKKYFVSKIDNSDYNDMKKYNDNAYNFSDIEEDSISSFSNIDDNNQLLKRSKSCYFTKNKIFKVKYNKSKSITKIIRNISPKKLNLKNNNIKKQSSDKCLKTKGIVPKLSYKSIRNYRKKEKQEENKPVIISESERENISLLSKDLLYFGKIITDGNFFGDQEMCKKQKRKYSIYCLKDCHLFSLKKEYFDKYILSKIIRSELLKTNFILDKLNVVQKEQHFFSLIAKIEPKLYNKGHILYTPFEIADHLYLVYKGECAICETVKEFEDKSDFFAEKPEMKIISILNEGGIGGLEGYQKNVNYEKYMIVNSSPTIILKLDLKDFDDNTNRFRRSLEPLYYQQQRMLFSIQRKGLFFKIGREINKNDEEKIKLKNDIKNSTILRDKNIFSIKYQFNNKFKLNNKITKNKKTLFNKSHYNNQNKQINENDSLKPLKSLEIKNTIPNNYRIMTETKIYSPIKLLIKEKKLEIEDTTSVLTSFIKENKNNNLNNTQKSLTIETNLKNFDEYNNNNKSITDNTVFKQKRYYSFYHQKFGRNPISLKGYFSQEKNDNQINKFKKIKNNILNIRASLNKNVFNFYNQLSKDIKNNKDINGKRFSWDKGKTNFPEDTFMEKDSKNNNKLNIQCSIKSRKSFKLKRNTKMFNKFNIKLKTSKFSNFKPKLPSLSNNF